VGDGEGDVGGDHGLESTLVRKQASGLQRASYSERVTASELQRASYSERVTASELQRANMEGMEESF